MEYAKERCTGTKTDGSGQRCGNWPLRGAKVCRKHGGGAPQVRAAAARNLMQGELRSLLQKHGRDIPITDPLTALQEHAGKVRAWMDFLEDRIGALRHSSQWDTEQVRGEVQLFTDAQSQVRQTLVDM